MPGKQKKYNSRFPPARIKKIMQADEEIGKVAAAVPVIISRTIERFIHSLLSRAAEVTLSNNVKTLTPSHIKQSILSQPRLNFMLDICKNIPDVGGDPIPNSFQLPSNSIIKNEVKEEQTEITPFEKKNTLKRSISLSANLPKRKRGRPRKEKFVDEDNNENDVQSCLVKNSFDEDNKNNCNLPKRHFTSSLSNMTSSEMEVEKEVTPNFLKNIKINIPGFGSSSLTIGNTATQNNSASQQDSTTPALYNYDNLPNVKSEMDEDYD